MHGITYIASQMIKMFLNTSVLIIDSIGILAHDCTNTLMLLTWAVALATKGFTTYYEPLAFSCANNHLDLIIIKFPEAIDALRFWYS